MERLNKSLYMIGSNCFNKDTLEIFSFDNEHIMVLKLLTSGQSVPVQYSAIAEEIKSSGLTDECQDQQSELEDFSPKFVGFRLVLGKVCNLRCRDCFVLEPGFTPKKMSSAELEAIIKKTFVYGKDREIKYHFFGGEPLMMFDLVKKGVAQIEQAYTDGVIKEPIFTITTNGTLITDEIASFFKNHNFKVGISIDGPKENNDLIRGEGVFDKVCAAFRLLEKYNIERWFLITPYSDIIDLVPDFVDELYRQFSFKTITFNTPFSGDDLTWMVDGQILADTILECHKRAKKTNLNIESAVAPILYALSAGVKRNYSCSIAGDQIMGSISPDGRISVCAQYWSDDLFKQKFLYNFSFAIKHQRIDVCKNCVAENICGGPCFVRYAKTNTVDKNKCKFYVRLVEKLISDPEEYLTDDQFSEQAV